MTPAALQSDPAGLAEALQGPAPAVAAKPAALRAAKWYMRLVVHRRVVNVRHARVQPVGDGQPALLVWGFNAGRQAVFAVVREFDGVILVFGDIIRPNLPLMKAVGRLVFR